MKKKKEETPPPPPFVEVSQAVSSKRMPYIFQTIGNTVAYATVNVRPQVNGEVTGYYFKDGAFIKEGDLLTPSTKGSTKPICKRRKGS